MLKYSTIKCKNYCKEIRKIDFPISEVRRFTPIPKLNPTLVGTSNHVYNLVWSLIVNSVL